MNNTSKQLIKELVESMNKGESDAAFDGDPRAEEAHYVVSGRVSEGQMNSDYSIDKCVQCALAILEEKNGKKSLVE